LETENINKKHEKASESPKERRPTTTPNYNTVGFIHSKFSNLISSGSVYSIRYSPKKKHALK
jgi:hypothetical protein